MIEGWESGIGNRESGIGKREAQLFAIWNSTFTGAKLLCNAKRKGIGIRFCDSRFPILDSRLQATNKARIFFIAFAST